MDAVHCQGLQKKFGKQVALAGVNLDIPEYGIFGLLGPNGAGKTTLLRILTGQISYSVGECSILGCRIDNANNDFRRQIGFLSQNPRYYGWMSGRELLDFTGSLFGFPKQERRRRSDQLLDMISLSEAADRKISGYSGGMVQRLGIAQALYHDPKILFLDEPVSALDPVGRKDILEFIHSLRGNMTVIMSTHILEDVERVCSDIAIMESGKVLLQGRTGALLSGKNGVVQSLCFEKPEDVVCLSRNLQDNDIPFESSGLNIRFMQDVYKREQGRVLGVIAENNLMLEQISREKISLEDLFVELVSGGTRNAR